MSNPLLDILNVPRPTNEILDKLKEKGYEWSEDQLKLYAELDKDVHFKDGQYLVETVERSRTILMEVDRIMGNYEITTIPAILNEMPLIIQTTKEEIAAIIRKSEQFEILSNNIAIKRKKNKYL